MLTASSPSMVAVALESGAGPVVLDALAQDRDVIVAPPICDSTEELDAIAELAGRTERRLIAAHTYRGHPASRVVKELADTGILGRIELVALLLGDTTDDGQVRRATLEGLDLFLWLTGATTGTVATVTEDGSGEQEPPEVTSSWGELSMVVSGVRNDDGAEATFEVRQRSDASDSPEVIQVVGNQGAVEWNVRTGLQRSAINTPQPVTISCGLPPDPAEWVLTNLLRARRPVISTEHSIATTRLLLGADLSRQRHGEPQPWQL